EHAAVHGAATGPDRFGGPWQLAGGVLVPRQATFAREGAPSWGSPRSSEAESGGACSRCAGREPSYWTYLGFRPVRREGVPGAATGQTLPVAALDYAASCR